ncbi:autoinducer binding domain-containing protein [Mitsuaria sp. WAJ17]|uniref:autoinducer binding domain-containing protein n=1 Tax=Mitsuaria sp. WAJ17 TaxID=2761452 RepID=UPI0016027D2F|nr:autoinducer binding domain-containing protein [Mitsuaria sp. WAJ17]MBB2487041.1 autoinducer binding domain-containing protein [Mitsuaria sp. WAJ17]
MLDANLQDLLNAGDVEDYRACVVRFTQSMDFGTMDAMTVLDDSAGNPEFTRIENINNPSWVSIDPAYGRRDPAMQHLKRSSYPIAWGSTKYRDPAVVEGYEVVASMGLRSGISDCIALP